MKLTLEEQLGDWSRLLKPTLSSDYMKKLGIFLNGQYKRKVTYPKRDEIFRAFKLCKHSDVKVVIIGTDPYPSVKATGIPFGNRESDTRTSPTLLKIKEAVESSVGNGLVLDFDITLESWSKQGVLMLNKALTVNKYKPKSHLLYWDKFIVDTIKMLNEYNSGIVYCLWGGEARKLAKYINSDNNYILQCTHPIYALKENQPWICNHFKVANHFLKKNNDEEIKWC